MIKFWKVWFIIVPFNSLCQNSILLYLSNLHYFIVSVQFTKQDHLDNLDSKCLIVRAPFSCRFKINYWLFWISSSQFQFWFHQIVLPLFWYFKFWTTNFGFFNRMNFLLKPIGVVIIIRNSYVHIFIPFRSLIHSTYHRHQQKHQHTSSLFSFQLISLLVSIDRHFNAMAKKHMIKWRVYRFVEHFPCCKISHVKHCLFYSIQIVFFFTVEWQQLTDLISMWIIIIVLILIVYQFELSIGVCPRIFSLLDFSAMSRVNEKHKYIICKFSIDFSYYPISYLFFAKKSERVVKT